MVALQLRRGIPQGVAFLRHGRKHDLMVALQLRRGKLKGVAFLRGQLDLSALTRLRVASRVAAVANANALAR